ncbi:MAG: ATP-binding protein [Bacteroidales bacterium]|nr:ATP-binding protein [Bacteroidales bacterium]
MNEQQQNIRDKQLFKYSSTNRYLKIHVPDFAFKHDDNNVGKDKFVGREVQIRKLFTWLTSDSKSGSYLITGYRGMGKSILVKRVIDMISREPKAYKEVLFQFAMLLTLIACFIGIALDDWRISAIFGAASLIVVLFLEASKQINEILFEYNIRKVPLHNIFDKDMIAKVWLKNKDRRNRKYSNIAITVNLGQEVLNERDVLSLIAHNIREKYYKFVHNRQNSPITNFIYFIVSGILSFLTTKYLFIPLIKESISIIVLWFSFSDSWISSLVSSAMDLLNRIITYGEPIQKISTEIFSLFFTLYALIYLLFYLWTIKILKTLRKKIPYFSIPYNSLEKLDTLCERVASSMNEEKGTHPQYSSSFFNFSFGKAGKSKSTPIATVRELEQELMEIINDINGEDCPIGYQAQFIIVFDELDKIANVHKKGTLEPTEDENDTMPAYEASVKGFTESVPYEQRKQNVLRLLANMKLFITSVKAKCVFISGHELFDASLADLSDREFAISSIFNGVLNVTSFLSPEREEADVSSMTEVYLATMLLPESELKNKLQRKDANNLLHQLTRHIKDNLSDKIYKIVSFGPFPPQKSYLKQKIAENIRQNGILKDELPSLRWYNQYLMEIHILNNTETLSCEEIKERELEIRHVMEFLRNFCVYLSHISNGSPKKIATYFEKYVRVNYDTIKQFDWYDEIEVGLPTEDGVRKQCVLYFDQEAQRLINFIHYIAAPVMNAITNEVSHYGDKLLVSSSFILDQIYKYHGKGFSWRNLEQMPELLNTNKNPELRDSLASIMEFLLQTHITTISSSIFQYKFHKQIAEEISMLSKTSEEAAAIFNFTLNESEAVKRYNTRLLWNYMSLTNQTKDKSQKERYCGVLERLHENQGDIYFSEEDYYRAIHEYRSALQYIDDRDISAKNLIPYLKCSLKVGMSYEYRHTFENAYMVYCQIINKLIHLRWVEEKTLGLDYTMRLTQDWRVKQAVLVDADSMKGWFSNECNSDIRRHFKPGLMEDLIESSSFKPEYSIDSDKTISHLTKNFTPEKSDILLQLTAFEDVKFIYQAILAKLFVIEKMESSGITQSSIDAAEAEFITLYSTVNYREKYILASDFFSKLSSILYYKNGVVSAEKDENIYTTLLLFDIDILALLDDYCYYVNKSPNSSNAIEIKNDIISFFTTIKTSEINMEWGSEYKNLSSFNSALLDKNKIKLDGVSCDNAQRYLEYFDKKNQLDIQRKWEDIKECFERRYVLAKYGCKLPCTACKYANRSIVILMKQLFGYDSNSGLKVIQMLRYSSHQRLFESRPEILSQLAASSEQLADIMISCSCTRKKEENDYVGYKISFDRILPSTIELVSYLISETDSFKRKTKLDEYQNKMGNVVSRMDLTVLWYWCASRYYDIASMHHEAVHCIGRIVNVIENYLYVLSYHKNRNKVNVSIDGISEPLLDLLNQLFTQASRIVGRQHDNYNSVEIHELKWMLHFEHVEDIDLTKLTQFPNLQSIFISIVNSKMMILNLNSGSSFDANKRFDETRYVERMYRWIIRNRHVRTFKSDVELNYLKAKLNHTILMDILENYDVKQEHFNKKEPIGYYYPHFYKNLGNILWGTKHIFENHYVKAILGKECSTTQEVLDLLDFLIYDSIRCLCNVINALPPHNQTSTFTNSFIANVYEDLWEWSKYYNMMYDLYLYYRYYLSDNKSGMESMMKYSPSKEKYKNFMLEFVSKLKNANVILQDDFGFRYSKLFMTLRHDIDDATMHHILIDYSAEMAIKYYRAARGINSEGQEYKNLINNMYILDDDLRNDTCQSNMADERYLINSGVVNQKRKDMQELYSMSKINTIDSYENGGLSQHDELTYFLLQERFRDSPYTNTEY